MSKEPAIQNFLFAGDTHSHLENLSRWVSLWQSLKKTYPNALSIYTGDFLGSSIQSAFSQGQIDIHILSQVLNKNSVLTLGNHDFDFGENILLKLLKKLNVPTVVTNIQYNNLMNPFKSLLKSFHSIQTPQHRYIFFGLLPYEMKFTSQTLQTLKVFNFIKTLSSLKKMMKQFAVQDGKTTFILLSHLGIDLDYCLAQNFKNIIIFGGHSHSILPYFKNDKTGSIIVHAGFNAQFVGKLSLTYVAQQLVASQGELMGVTAMPKSKHIQGLVKILNDKIVNKLQINITQQLCDLPVKQRWSGLDWHPVNDSHAGQARVNDTFITRLMSDAMVQAIGRETKNYNFLGLFHGGGVRCFLPAGKIRYTDVFSALPFPQHLVTVRMRGADLLTALELGIAQTNWHQRAGLLHPSIRLRYGYDLTLPRGSRLTFVMIDEKAIETDKVYDIVTNNWVAAGQDGLVIFKKLNSVSYPHLKQVDVFIQYLQKNKQAVANCEITADKLEKFGERILSRQSFDQTRQIANQQEYSRGKEPILKLKEVNLAKFLPRVK